MAEVTVSTDDGGAIQEAGAAEAPAAADTELPPLPEMTPEPQVPSYSAAERRQAPVTRPIVPDEWVNDEDDYWTTQSLIAISGRRAVPRPRARTLEPPQRFQPLRRWQSMAVLIVLSVVILATCIGLLRAVNFANDLVHPHQAVPTLTVPTHTPAPTAKPHNK